MIIGDYTGRLLAKGESATLEFKASPERKDMIARAVCAFLNTHGGVVLVGVDDDGRPNGSVTENHAAQLQRFLRDRITPRVLFDVSFDHTSRGDVISLGIPAGADRPYVFDGAVFVRVGASTRPATASILRELVEKSTESPTRWERRPSVGLEVDGIELPLLRETVRRAADRRGSLFESPEDPVATLSQLSLLQSGQLTNGADVLFGKKVSQRHPQTRLRAVCYSSDRAGDFLDEQLYEGPAFRLLEDATAFLKRHVAIGTAFHEGELRRESKPKYPFFALREGLVNALVHRDYAAFSGSVSVSIYPDRVEIWNTGKLPRGISPRDLLLASHLSILVNPDIGHVFYLHELMERVGRGTFKIAQECREVGMRVPEWKNVGSGVRLTMFAAQAGVPAGLGLNDRQKELLEKLVPGEQIRVSDYLERFGHGITDRQARRDLSDLEGDGILVRHGAGSKTTYERTTRGV
jgi:ATP-dependent DNA helicase RecG